jgi:hypothetical protein
VEVKGTSMSHPTVNNLSGLFVGHQSEQVHPGPKSAATLSRGKEAVIRAADRSGHSPRCTSMPSMHASHPRFPTTPERPHPRAAKAR